MKLPSPKWGGGKFITVKTSRMGLFGTCLQVWKTYPPHEISTSTPLPLLSILKQQHPPHSLLKSYSPLEKCPTINARATTLPLLYSVNIKGILLSSHPSPILPQVTSSSLFQSITPSMANYRIIIKQLIYNSKFLTFTTIWEIVKLINFLIISHNSFLFSVFKRNFPVTWPVFQQWI